MKHSIACILLLFVMTGLYGQQLIDKKATTQTKALYSNLIKISQQGFLFGHQDTDAYGVEWKGMDRRSDVKDVVGVYPAVHGWDIGKLGRSNNLDGVKFDSMIHWIKETYKRGGINTISWHLDNPVTKKDSWDKTPAVKEILPGGSAHVFYCQQLDIVANFFNQCKIDKEPIPIIFRPFHEHNGDWFWWGKGLCTEEEYIQLWKFTVNYFKDKKKINHLIYAFSPDRSRLDLASAKTSYSYGYPGDDFVDIIGIDNYMDVGVKWNTKSKEEQKMDLVKSLQLVSAIAKEKNKVAALTETGLEGITHTSWFTDVILKPIKETDDIKIAYMLVWRNANTKHHYAPYRGHPAAEDFKDFYKDERTFFEGDIQSIYKAQ